MSKSIEETMTDFDKKQRLFLGGKYHSTEFNKWLRTTLEELQQEKEEAVREERERVLKIVTECCRTTEPEWIYQDIMEVLTRPKEDSK